MKLFRMLGYSIRDALKSVKRNFSLSIASISCISITLLVVSVALIMSFNVRNFSKQIEEDVTMVVFLNFGVTDQEIADFENKLDKMENVLPGWIAETPQDRKELLLEEDEFWKSVGTLINNDDEIFHQCYRIKVKDVTKIKDTAKQLNEDEVVSYVNYGEEMVEEMVSLFSVINKIAFGIVIVLVFVTVFLIVNTIKLTIFSRRREISIMRVVGASNFTIKNPFIVEGFLIGLIGSVVPVIVTIFGYNVLYNRLDNGHLFSSMVEFIDPEPFVYLISLIIILIGVIVGMIGSARAVRRYLKI